MLGRNGVGKTTLMRYIMGLHRRHARAASSSTAASLPAAPAERARAGLGYVPQGRHVFPRLTVRENIIAAAAACHRPPAGDARRDLREVSDSRRARQSQLGRQPERRSAADPGDRPRARDRAEGTAARRADRGRAALDHRRDRARFSIGSIASAGIAVLLAEQNLDFAMSLDQPLLRDGQGDDRAARHARRSFCATRRCCTSCSASEPASDAGQRGEGRWMIDWRRLPRDGRRWACRRCPRTS